MGGIQCTGEIPISDGRRGWNPEDGHGAVPNGDRMRALTGEGKCTGAVGSVWKEERTSGWVPHGPESPFYAPPKNCNTAHLTTIK